MHVDLNDRIYVDYLMAEMGAAELRAVFAGDIQLGARILVPTDRKFHNSPNNYDTTTRLESRYTPVTRSTSLSPQMTATIPAMGLQFPGKPQRVNRPSGARGDVHTSGAPASCCECAGR